MKFITNGLIIKELNIGEKDKLVTVLTDTNGVIKGFVHGARDIKSPKCAATGLLNYSRLTLYRRRDNYTVGDSKSLKVFGGLRNSVENMYLGQYFCQLAEAVCPKEQEAKEQLSLILNGLYLLSEGKRPLLAVKACVELRLMCLSGYMPDIMMCRHCGEYEKDNMLFLPRTGQLLCQNCRGEGSEESFAVKLNTATLKALRHCCYADKDKLFSFSLPEKELKTLNFCSEEYMRFVLERDFKTLQFLKSIT